MLLKNDTVIKKGLLS